MKGNFAILLLLTSISFAQQASADTQMTQEQAFAQAKAQLYPMLAQIAQEGIEEMEKSQRCLESAQQQETFDSCLNSMDPTLKSEMLGMIGPAPATTQAPSNRLIYSTETQQSAIQFLATAIANSKVVKECYSADSVAQVNSCMSGRSGNKPANNTVNPSGDQLNEGW